MPNSVDPDQMASSEAIWSGSTLFSKVMHILVQQGKVKQSDMRPIELLAPLREWMGLQQSIQIILDQLPGTVFTLWLSP